MGRLRAWLRGLLELNGTPRGIVGGFALGVGLSLIPVPVLGVVLALAAASVGLVVYSVRRRWLLAELLAVRKERGVGE